MEKLSRLQDNSLLLKKIITPLLPPVTRPTLKSEDFSNKLVTTGTKPSKLDLDLRDSLSTPSRLKLILRMEKLPWKMVITILLDPISEAFYPSSSTEPILRPQFLNRLNQNYTFRSNPNTRPKILLLQTHSWTTSSTHSSTTHKEKISLKEFLMLPPAIWDQLLMSMILIPLTE